MDALLLLVVIAVASYLQSEIEFAVRAALQYNIAAVLSQLSSREDWCSLVMFHSRIESIPFLKQKS